MLTVTLNPSVDVSTGVAVVEPERKLHCGSTRREAGGGGVNVARVAHVLGADVTALVLVGGCGGAQLLDLLAAQGVTTEAIPIAADTAAQTRRLVAQLQRLGHTVTLQPAA